MFKNHLRVAFRTLYRQRGHAAINVGGLALGLACCFVIFQFVAFEAGFDRFHANERDLYRVTTAMGRAGDTQEGSGAFTPQAAAPALAAAVPEILRVARVHPMYDAAVVSNPARPERVFEEARAFYVDPAFLAMFSFPLVAGDARTALAEPGTVLLSETTARKYFGTTDAVGQTLSVTAQTEGPVRVAGVFADVPAQSHLQFDLLLPAADLLRSEQYATEPEGGWSWNNFATYIQLRPGADLVAAERKMKAVVEANIGEGLQESGFTLWGVQAQPLRDIHLDATVESPTGPEGTVLGDRRTVYFFTVIGLVTLLIALVNYVNLATARALDRAREVGVRKAVGAQRGQLVAQFLSESALTVLAAAVLGAALAAGLTPLVNRLAGTHLSLASWLDPVFWAALAGTLGVGALLAGLYPAFVLSSFRPATALRGTSGASTGGLGLRRGLVVLQFTASVVLIGGTAVVTDQLHYLRGMDLGLDLEQVLTVASPRVTPEGSDDAAGEAAFSAFVEELRRLPGVRAVAASYSLPGDGFNWNGAMVRKAEDDPAQTIRSVGTWIDTSFVELYGMEMLATSGPEAFTPLPDSTERPWALLANETAVRALGYASTEAALGEAIDFGGNDARIVGVVRDFRWSSGHEEQQSIFLGRIDAGEHVSLRVGTDGLPGTVAAVRAVYDRSFPGNVFSYAFADETFDRQYRDDERFATLFALFAGLAIAIACLGLFGLASFTAEQRRKEIGIRKVLGASVRHLVTMLSRDFVVLVAVSIVVAAPLVYWLMGRWLEPFAYRVPLGPGVLAAAGAVALAIALATVAGQAFRAASADPITALRSD